MKATRLILGFLILALAGCGASASQPETQTMTVSTDPADGGAVTREAWDIFDGLYSSVWMGRYLDEAPARQRAAELRAQGLTAFVLKKHLSEKRLFGNQPAGDFYLVMAGLFGRKDEAALLAGRLEAQGLARSPQVVPVDDPGEIESGGRQTQAASREAAEISRKAAEKAARPLGPDSAAASGRAFKKMIYGRFVKSFKDPLEAQAEAQALTAAGWPAAVEAENEGGTVWHRVYMADTADHRDWKADPKVLAQAQKQAASQPGIIILADMSMMRGSLTVPGPDASRDDASACAGYSEAGRLFAALSRTVNYIPDTSYQLALTPVSSKTTPILETHKRVKDWWDDKPSPTKANNLYGLSIFSRPEVEKAVTRLVPDPDAASLAMGLDSAERDLTAIPGRKVLLVFSEFQGSDKAEAVKAAAGRLLARHGRSLAIIYVYGDAGGDGFILANDLARAAGTGQAWDGCRILHDNAYFEKFIKAIFS